MKSDGPARVGVPLSIQGDEVFYILGALTVVTAVLVRTMTLLSCTLALVLLAVPLYGIVVAGVPFSIDLVISFERSQSWPVGRAANRRAPAVSLQATQEQVERPVRREKLGPGKSSNMIPGDLGVRSDKSFDDAKSEGDEKNGSGKGQAIPSPTDEKYIPDRVEPGWSNQPNGTNRVPASLFKQLDAENFNLRAGPDYARNKKKMPSLPAFYDFKCGDIFCCTGSGAMVNVAKNIDLSKLVPDRSEGWIEGVPKLLISCLQFSIDDDTRWFGKSEKTSIKTYGIIMYFHINSYGISELKKNSNAARLYRRFCSKELENLRFKSIIKIKDKEKLGLNFMLRKSLDQLDGKPFLAGKVKDGKTARFLGDCYLEMDSLTQNYTYLARKGIATCKSKLINIRFHYGLCIEAQQDEEMPEQILAAVEIGPGVDYNYMFSPVNWIPHQWPKHQ
ncbi:hypothetical protein AAMO2058_001348700 [Amorphochlora amoebiformis]